MDQTTPTLSDPATHAEPPLKRLAIIGTAPSWRQCPWNDRTLMIAGLNDAYVMNMPRMDLWFDLHPWSRMFFHDRSQGQIEAHNLPAGTYMRPKDHLRWLATQSIPVYVAQAPAGHPTLRTFPIQDIERAFAGVWPLRRRHDGVLHHGPFYSASTPALILMWAILEGYQEIHIYGIHLATAWEYVEQRPNLEGLIMWARGRGVQIVLPDDSPICKAQYRYAYEAKSNVPIETVRHKIARLKLEGKQFHDRLASQPWFRRQTWWATRLAQVNLELAGAHEELGRLQLLTQFSDGAG